VLYDRATVAVPEWGSGQNGLWRQCGTRSGVLALPVQRVRPAVEARDCRRVRGEESGRELRCAGGVIHGNRGVSGSYNSVSGSAGGRGDRGGPCGAVGGDRCGIQHADGVLAGDQEDLVVSEEVMARDSGTDSGWSISANSAKMQLRMITARAYSTHMDHLFERLKRLHAALDSAGIEYRVIGGLAVFLQVSLRRPGRGRTTEDVDIAIDRRELERIAKAAEKFGFRYRHAAGLDMLVDAEEPRASTAVHLVFINEKVRPEYLEAVPGFSEPTRTEEGILLAPVADLVKMKLTSFRMKDQLHLKDLDSARLITPEIEKSLPEALRGRLVEVRALR